MDLRNVSFLFLFCAFLFPSCGQEGTSNEETEEAAEELNEEMAEGHVWVEEDDAEFLVEAYSYNLMIARYSELASQKATTPALQDFASKSLQYHTNLNSEIEAMAAEKVVALPSAVGENVQEYLVDLQEKEGLEFDEAYTEVLDNIQDKIVDEYEDAAEDAADMNLRAWASSTLPNLKAHELTTEELEETVE